MDYKDYKKEIIKMIEKLENVQYLESIYYFIRKLLQ